MLRKDEGRSVAAQECELRDRSAGDLRRHEADIVFYHHILAPAIRPAQGVELQLCLLSGSKIDGSGLAGIKRQEAESGHHVMPGLNIAVKAPSQLLVPDCNAVQRYRFHMVIVKRAGGLRATVDPNPGLAWWDRRDNDRSRRRLLGISIHHREQNKC